MLVRLLQRRYISTLTDHYRSLVASNTIRRDSEQERVVSALDELSLKLATAQPVASSWFRRQTSFGVKGLYIYGTVGCGKTMLMDMFYNNCTGIPKSRVHFNKFMINFHKKLHSHKLSGTSHPVKTIATDIARESPLICFDEFQVVDIGDAMILRLLFEELFAHSITIVATSNRPPEDLYKNGLQRGSFLPFIPILREHADAIHLNSHVDYRLLTLTSKELRYIISDEDSNSKLEVLYKTFCSKEEDSPRPAMLTVYGRQLYFEKACGSVLFTDFNILCRQPLGPADYATICQRFRTLILADVPQLSLSARPELRRFITLIDTLYDNRVRLIVEAAVELSKLFVAGEVGDLKSSHLEEGLVADLNLKGTSAAIFTGEEETFAWSRTLSRLTEMQGELYWNSACV